MTEVKIIISPPISGYSPNLALPIDKTLSLEEFGENNIPSKLSYAFGADVVDYGICNLYDYYIDVCEEILRLDSGSSHNVEMSGYTVAQASLLDKDMMSINIPSFTKENSVTFKEVKIARSEFRRKLVVAKAQIESYVRSADNITYPSSS